ncbi:uncharacterized protein [Cicer arietinum]|uniref:Uncharacterized protein LOC101499955 n=1 Tax=Cicer arietinum TaxID=3827 RepID=A0A1S2XNM6_CICAR|nr:uncharacterized protein LOC101499955 [Cicer arietinum]
MKSLSSVGLGLSIVFGCLLLALVAEVYYLLWWKKRIIKREIENDNVNPMKEIFHMFCWKTSSTSFTPPNLCSSMTICENFVHDPELQQQQQQSHSQNTKDFLFKTFGDQDGMEEADYMMMRQQNDPLVPPRFLFTIVEESKEDLESEDGNKSKCGKDSNGRSLGDLLDVETPYLTPIESPNFFTPPFTPINCISPYNQHGFNPLFESATDAEFNKIKSSPPPKFKFLQEAEEKLRRKLQDDDSLLTIVVDKKFEREVNHQFHPQQYHSSTSQVLPLAS